MSWSGWGDPAQRVPLSESALTMLREELPGAVPAAPVELEDVSLPPARDLPSALSPFTTSRERADRIRCAAGKSYPDLVRIRSGVIGRAPDAVLLPASTDEITAILKACAREGVAVVPFGGGTSVVGGVDPEPGAHQRVVALDLRRLGHFSLDRRSMTAQLGSGLLGPQAEAALADHGFTLGHFPQSFEFATIGGFAATRSAGQASAGYGRFDDLVSAARMVTPEGMLATLETPHTAAGPALRELIVGSEGTLGVISDVTVRVRPAPSVKRYEGWIAADFEAGYAAVRALAQAGALPDVCRLSDRDESRVSLAMSSTQGLARRAFEAYVGIRGRGGGCIMIAGWEGAGDEVRRRRAASVAILRRHGVVPLGKAPGRAWAHGRFRGPYLRDELMDRGYFVETLETSHTWARYGELYEAVGAAIRDALAAQGTPGIVMCHLSHAYSDGASLYYTFIAPRLEGREIEQWRRAKTAACEAIVTHGGTITHHHAVGRDHAPYMTAEVGALGVDALRAIKDRLDPAGIMNPGKLLPG
ncbi:MAG: FAD-binding oxidoreductase [Actinomycetota bacterium]|nr:FAD-binding oxidoreductase [Actinomycetota bacterium]